MSFFGKIPLAIKYLFDGEVPFRKKLWVLFGLIYFISPIDLIPAPVLGLSIIDDLVLITFIINKMSSDLDKYKINLERRKKEKDIKKDIIEDVDYDIKDDNPK